MPAALHGAVGGVGGVTDTFANMSVRPVDVFEARFVAREYGLEGVRHNEATDQMAW